MPKPKRHVFVCQNDRGPEKACCLQRGSENILNELRKKVKVHFKNTEVKVTSSGCLGPCELGVNIVIYPDGIWYHGVTMNDVDDIFQQHLIDGHPVQRLMKINETF
ncbi:MAG: hypothetical protein A3I05_01005 [Deltaproteobacteria bacterium RIFCSPLOWO2_02_FULL_44_10]|nr:MAG: hypothetical protein A3C46_02065 [Deltaproteobacteria bacterium RIFCSPHIGHO2_02_FULL_44_16]OGQ45825.1 MAG: hypothetical protein A3I05_01005 [Deltaproteobacteria bacterium RIFCSPLOWO2_02_FULL_44_10]